MVIDDWGVISSSKSVICKPSSGWFGTLIGKWWCASSKNDMPIRNHDKFSTKFGNIFWKKNNYISAPVDKTGDLTKWFIICGFIDI